MDSPLKMAVQETGYNRYYYQDSDDQMIRNTFEKKIKPRGEDGWIYDPFIGIEKVRTQLLAYQCEAKAGYKAVSRSFTEGEKCSISEVSLVHLPMTTITVERNSGLKELFRQRFVHRFSLKINSII